MDEQPHGPGNAVCLRASGQRTSRSMVAPWCVLSRWDLSSRRKNNSKSEFMVSAILSAAFGVVGFLVFVFGFGASWDFALIIASVTSVALWCGDRATTKQDKVKRDGHPAAMATQKNSALSAQQSHVASALMRSYLKTVKERGQSGSPILLPTSLPASMQNRDSPRRFGDSFLAAKGINRPSDGPHGRS
jgi:hypothetical protein